MNSNNRLFRSLLDHTISGHIVDIYEGTPSPLTYIEIYEDVPAGMHLINMQFSSPAGAGSLDVPYSYSGTSDAYILVEALY